MFSRHAAILLILRHFQCPVLALILIRLSCYIPENAGDDSDLEDTDRLSKCVSPER